MYLELAHKLFELLALQRNNHIVIGQKKLFA